MENSMLLRKKRLVSVCLAMLLFVGLSANLCRAQSSFSIQDESDRLPWRRLSFKAGSFFGKVATEIRLATVPAKEAADLLLAVPQADALQPSGATVIAISVDSNIDPLIGSDEIFKTRAWYDAKDLSALQRDRLRQGRESWQKSYRFTDQGVFRLRTKPQDSNEDDLPPVQWTQVKEAFYAYNQEGLNCAVVLEPSALLYLVSANNFKIQELPLSLCVFNKKQLHRVKVSLNGQRRMGVNYLETAGGNQIRREQEIDAIKISFQPRALAPKNEEPEEFSFLGLNGDFDIYIDKTSQIPVQVSGKIPSFGNISLTLREVNLGRKDRNQAARIDINKK